MVEYNPGQGEPCCRFKALLLQRRLEWNPATSEAKVTTSSYGRSGILAKVATRTPPLPVSACVCGALRDGCACTYVHLCVTECRQMQRNPHRNDGMREFKLPRRGCSIFWVLNDTQQVVKSLQQPLQPLPLPFVCFLPVLMPPPAYAPRRYVSLLSHAFLCWAELKEKISM